MCRVKDNQRLATALLSLTEHSEREVDILSARVNARKVPSRLYGVLNSQHTHVVVYPIFRSDITDGEGEVAIVY